MGQIVDLQKNNNDWIKNIISTISGVILGSILTYIFQNRGGYKIFLISNSLEYLKNISGIVQNVSIDEEPNWIKIKAKIDFQNKSSRNNAFRNMCCVFRTRKENLEFKIQDDETRHYSGIIPIVENMEILNLEPFQIIRKSITVQVDIKHLDKFRNKYFAAIQYRDEKNRVKLFKIMGNKNE